MRIKKVMLNIAASIFVAATLVSCAADVSDAKYKATQVDLQIARMILDSIITARSISVDASSSK